MAIQPVALAIFASWVATGLGVGMWLWSWFREKNAIRKMRMLDSGAVLVFAAILVRIVTQERAMTPFDWALTFLSPLFIAAALWRLTRSACPPGEG